MAKGLYIGVDSKARKSKKMYFGVDNKARKIKKVYIGVENKARLMFTGDPNIVYKGTTDPFSIARQSFASINIGNYGIFAGGAYNSSGYATTEVYNYSLTKSSSVGLSVGRIGPGAAPVGDYAVIAGGANKLCTSDAINSSLVLTKLNQFLNYSNVASAYTSKYAMFFGGYADNSYTNYIHFTDSSLSTVRTGMGTEKRDHATGTHINGYALFAGGMTNTNASSSTVHSVNSSRTYSQIASLSSSRGYLTSITTSDGNYAIFAGGASSHNIGSNAIDIYDKSLTKISTSLVLTSVAISPSSSNLGNCSLFFGGGSANFTDSGKTTVDSIDTSLTKKSAPDMSVIRWAHGSLTLGNYVIVGGGYSTSQDTSKVVDVYTIE